MAGVNSVALACRLRCSSRGSLKSLPAPAGGPGQPPGVILRLLIVVVVVVVMMMAMAIAVTIMIGLQVGLVGGSPACVHDRVRWCRSRVRHGALHCTQRGGRVANSAEGTHEDEHDAGRRSRQSGAKPRREP